MDVHAVLKALHQERELLNQAIVTLEILARGKGKRRGRPPRWLREGRRGLPHGPEIVQSSNVIVNRDSQAAQTPPARAGSLWGTAYPPLAQWATLMRPCRGSVPRFLINP